MRFDDLRVTTFGLLCGTAMASFHAAPALAQEQESAASTQGDMIVVVGTRLQNQRALGAKRNTVQISDSVAADEIGRLPDFNVGESLARVPGISIQTDQGEARFVSIRGLNPDYNTTLLDGSAIAVPDRDGRNVFMEVLPASVADRIEVFKTATPDLEGHAIGGVINLRTPSAFDNPGLNLKLQAEIGQYEDNEGFEGDGLSGTADLLFSNTFGAEDQFGIVVTGNYFKRNSYLPWAQFERFDFFDPVTGAEVGAYTDSAFAAPGQRRYHWYHNNRQRYGGLAKFEFRPSADFEGFVKAYYNIATDDEARQTDVFDEIGGNLLTNATETSGTLVGPGFRTRQYVGQFDFERSVWGVQGGGDLALGDGTTVKFRANYSGSRFENPESFVEWRRDSADYAYSYVRDGDAFNVTLNDPAAAFDFDLMPFHEYNFTERRLDEEIVEVSLDLVGEDIFASNGLGYMIGLKYRSLDREYDEERFAYQDTALNAYTLGASGLASIENVPNMPGILDDQGVIAIDTARVLPELLAYIDANPAEFSFNENITNDFRSDYGVGENVLAGYAAITHQGDKHNLVAGLRIEASDFETSGFRNVDGMFEPVTDGGDYINFLPSVNFSYFMDESRIIRAAYSRTIGRPKFSEFAPSRESLSTAGTIPTVSRSNPDLLPRVSDNIDVSFENYFDGGAGIISIAGFYKRIEGEIFVRTTEQLFTVDGMDVLTAISQPENAGQPTNLFGLEFNLVKNFDFLPAPLDGLGGSVNATKIWTDFKYEIADGTFFTPETMLGQANHVVNLALFYDKGPFSAKIAYNWTDIQAVSLNSNPDNIAYLGEDWALDFKAQYRVTDRAAVTFNAYNIAGKSEDRVTGRFLEQPGRTSNYGAAYFIGFSYKL